MEAGYYNHGPPGGACVAPRAHESRSVCKMDQIQLRFPRSMEMDDDALFEFCRANDEFRIERNTHGELLIRLPRIASSGAAMSRICALFGRWGQVQNSGRAFAASGFVLPNGAMRSPDVAWVSNERLAGVAKKHWKKFLPLCPDFVLELRSPTDRLGALKKKMEEYIAN